MPGGMCTRRGSACISDCQRPSWLRRISGWRRQALQSGEHLLAGFGLGSVVYSVLAIVLAVRAWQGLLVPLIVSSLQSGQMLQQVGAVVLLSAVAAPLVLASLVLVRRLVAR